MSDDNSNGGGGVDAKRRADELWRGEKGSGAPREVYIFFAF